MKKVFRPILFILFFQATFVFSQAKYTILIHGGAGNITQENLKNSEAYSKALDSALTVGETILKNGGTSLDAVEKTIIFLENCPLFNAGKGAVFTANGRNELDASIMNGKTLQAGAVAGVGDIKNPISAARLVMEKSEHVLLIKDGASKFARENGLEMVDSSYFKTEESWQRYLKAKVEEKHGTVGCVALDNYGNLAAGTSTGGMMMKKYGRVGDSPIIGAGTYANNATCAVSCTGHGEYFIRNCIAFQINALMAFKGLNISDACNYVIQEVLNKQGGTGGVIAVDSSGNYSFSFNTNGMFRAISKSDGTREIKMFK
jgi:L-asparaginase / beta-aspartyl-peptidase